MITKNDFENLAFAFADARIQNRQRQDVQKNLIEGGTTLEIELAKTFQQINPRFDQDKFFKRVQHLEAVKLGRAKPDESKPLG